MKPHTHIYDTLRYRSMTTTIKTNGLGEINANLRSLKWSPIYQKLFLIIPISKYVHNFGVYIINTELVLPN